MSRELIETDRLYLDYKNKGSKSSLKLLVDSVDKWLFEIIYYSVADRDLAKDFLKQVWSRFISAGSYFDLKKFSIEYHIYLIGIEIIYEYIKEKDGD